MVLQVSLFSVVAYFMIGFELDVGKFLFYWVALVLSCLNMVYFGMVVVCITPNMQMGVTVGATIMVRFEFLPEPSACSSVALVATHASYDI